MIAKYFMVLKYIQAVQKICVNHSQFDGRVSFSSRYSIVFWAVRATVSVIMILRVWFPGVNVRKFTEIGKSPV